MIDDDARDWKWKVAKPRAAEVVAKPQAGWTANCVLWIALFAVFAVASTARAGGGPENVLLVVNAESPPSMLIANHYAALRRIPSSNLLYLDWDPKTEKTDIDTFRKKILVPVMEMARLPYPGRRIDCVVYSCDFPWGIDINADVEKFKATLSNLEEKIRAGGNETDAKHIAMWKGSIFPVASITGLTYLWQPVVMKEYYCEPTGNWYVPPQDAEQKDAPARAFSAAANFGPHGELVAKGGRHYMLSMMLGVTAGRGNSIDEVLSYLRRSASADGTHPRGTIYYVKNGDVRSKVRDGEYPAAVRQLKTLGVQAEIDEGIMTFQKNDVQGVMMGTRDFDWKSSQSTILPGAICEHFTSSGGEMNKGADQTPLSEFLRYGAAASSGTVTEPYAIAEKFPSPMIQVYYARGCSVAEAFYQSIRCPFQLLIVGDPFCRPWANIPEVTIAGIEEGATVKGMIRIRPEAQFPGQAVADHFELVVDGLRLRECQPGGQLEFDTTLIGDGYHELRIVAVEKGPIRSQGEKILLVATDNFGRRIEATATPPGVVPLQQPLVIAVKSPGSTSIAVIQGTRLVGKIAGEQGRVEIKPTLLGAGPVRLRVIGVGGKGPQSNVNAKPIDLTIKDGA